MRAAKMQILKEKFMNKSFTTKDAHVVGVSSRMLTFYVKKGELERIGHGLYVLSDFNVDEDYNFYDLALVARSIKRSVICLISALGYWGITDEIPRSYWLAIPNNFLILKKATKVKFVRPRNLTTGVIEKIIADQRVKITTSERSICDAFKYLDEEAAITSLKMYLMQDKKKINISKLMDTAETLKAKRVLEIMKEKAHAAGKEYPEMNRENFKAYVSWLSAKRKQK